MAHDAPNPIRALREAVAAETAQRTRPVAALFNTAELWVELTDRGAVRVGEDGWVYAYTDQGMLPGGQLEGFGGADGLAVDDVTRMTGERLRYLVGREVGIIVDYGYSSECHIQVPAIAPVTRSHED